MRNTLRVARYSVTAKRPFRLRATQSRNCDSAQKHVKRNVVLSAWIIRAWSEHDPVRGAHFSTFGVAFYVDKHSIWCLLPNTARARKSVIFTFLCFSCVSSIFDLTFLCFSDLSFSFLFFLIFIYFSVRVKSQAFLAFLWWFKTP